jgi:hypothetical protein
LHRIASHCMYITSMVRRTKCSSSHELLDTRKMALDRSGNGRVGTYSSVESSMQYSDGRSLGVCRWRCWRGSSKLGSSVSRSACRWWIGVIVCRCHVCPSVNGSHRLEDNVPSIRFASSYKDYVFDSGTGSPSWVVRSLPGSLHLGFFRDMRMPREDPGPDPRSPIQTREFSPGLILYTKDGAWHRQRPRQRNAISQSIVTLPRSVAYIASRSRYP